MVMGGVADAGGEGRIAQAVVRLQALRDALHERLVERDDAVDGPPPETAQGTPGTPRRGRRP